LSRKSWARLGKHLRKKQAAANGRSETTQTVDYERVTALLSQRYPPDKLHNILHLIETGIQLYQSELAWSRHRLKIRDGLDKLGLMLADQYVAIEQIREIAPYQRWKERLNTQINGVPSILFSLPDAMVTLGRLLKSAEIELTPRPGASLAGRELVAMLIITLESYAGQRIGHSYKDDLAPLLKKILKEIAPEIQSGTIDETLRVRARGEELLPVWGGPPLPSPGDSDVVGGPVTFEQYVQLMIQNHNLDNPGEIDG